MTDIRLTLFCVVEGETPSNAFPVEIESTKTTGHLKNLIKAKKTKNFHDVAADKLTIWKVSISDEEERTVLLDNFPDRTKLKATRDLSEAFTEEPPKKTVHIIVERPSPQDTQRLQDHHVRQKNGDTRTV
ncbi:hypothetical protein BG005_006763 [Podila minutissima]|nr:hypothetical protein BG005_006763 [Podila minutissima]